MIEFARPALLALLLLVPAWLWWRRRRATAQPVSDAAIAQRAAGRSWWAEIPVALRVLAFACWVVAAAGPRLGSARVELRGEGIAIVLAIDVSSSMLAEDFTPMNRLEVAKRQALAFVRNRRTDRLGVVIFAGEALTLVPLTLDYAVVERAIQGIRIGMIEDGTAIGTGLATAVNRLYRVPSPSRVVLLLTDGENNRGAVDPRTAAEVAASLGVRVYTVGVGTEGEARVPTGRGITGLRYEMLPVRIDETLLQDIAERTGGRYYRATDPAALDRIFREVNELERGDQTGAVHAGRPEATRPFLLAGLGLLAFELLLGATLVVRLP
jgi:Ca-activated chloride channel family protein